MCNTEEVFFAISQGYSLLVKVCLSFYLGHGCLLKFEKPILFPVAISTPIMASHINKAWSLKEDSIDQRCART